jgi:plasmid segregation protein ParM
MAVNIAAAGIDIGFFSTKVTFKDANGNIVSDLFPSRAPRFAQSLDQSKMLDKLDCAVVDIGKGLRHVVGKQVELASTSGARAVTSDFSKTPDYRALYLGALYYITKLLKCKGAVEIEAVVGGLPLSTVYSHNRDVADMMMGKHTIPDWDNPEKSITVTVKQAVVIAQPQGTLASRPDSPGAEDVTLVVDMGGGTFDWFVAKGLIPNRGRCGAVPIGALACASAICDEIDPSLKDDMDVVARVDLALRENRDSFTITGRRYELKAYAPVLGRVVGDAIEQMRRGVGNLSSVDRIIVTGGGGRLAFEHLKSTLSNYAGIMKLEEDAVLANSRGFHLVAEAILEESTT